MEPGDLWTADLETAFRQILASDSIETHPDPRLREATPAPWATSHEGVER